MGHEPVDEAAERAAYEEGQAAADKAAASAATRAEILHLAIAGLDRSASPIDGAESWRPSDLGPFLRGEKVVEPPAYLLRDDGVRLVYPGRPNSFWGASESLKTFAAVLTARSVLASGGNVVYLDWESDEATFVTVARLVGIDEQVLADRSRIIYIRPDEPFGDAAAHRLSMIGEALLPALVVIDGVTECYALEGWDTNSATDVATYQRVILRGFARAGAATIEIDHTAKMVGQGQLGSQHKRAGIDGVSLEFRSIFNAGVGGVSRAEVYVSKDRHGLVQPHMVTAGKHKKLIGTLIVDSSSKWSQGVRLLAPNVEELERRDAAAEDQAFQDILDKVAAEPGRWAKTPLAAALPGRKIDNVARIDELLLVGRLVQDGKKLELGEQVPTGPDRSRDLGRNRQGTGPDSRSGPLEGPAGPVPDADGRDDA